MFALRYVGKLDAIVVMIAGAPAAAALTWRSTHAAQPPHHVSSQCHRDLLLLLVVYSEYVHDIFRNSILAMQ